MLIDDRSELQSHVPRLRSHFECVPDIFDPYNIHNQRWWSQCSVRGTGPYKSKPKIDLRLQVFTAKVYKDQNVRKDSLVLATHPSLSPFPTCYIIFYTMRFTIVIATIVLSMTGFAVCKAHGSSFAFYFIFSVSSLSFTPSSNI